MVALNNDRANFTVEVNKTAEAMIIDRHEANGELFAAFFDKPGFRQALVRFLADAYDEIRAADAAS